MDNDMHDFLNSLLGEKVTEMARIKCPGCDKGVKVKLSEKITEQFNRMDALMQEINNLSRTLDRMQGKLDALKTLAWEEIHEYYPESLGSVRCRIIDGNTVLSVYSTCKECMKPLKEVEED